ncbi:hypothetical protein GWI33_006560 [Rhynchophorus ferrugineus]|uniref:Uncharacterized protein n=1 Tax=Rhynchophorus ferrugineus TaxID=354439 RepID=A0A834IUF8_RHYFE|nr:hypothetical protein GWI33_006560 [Rhynchophorus ferrugineus]
MIFCIKLNESAADGLFVMAYDDHGASIKTRTIFTDGVGSSIGLRFIITRTLNVGRTAVNGFKSSVDHGYGPAHSKTIRSLGETDIRVVILQPLSKLSSNVKDEQPASRMMNEAPLSEQCAIPVRLFLKID